MKRRIFWSVFFSVFSRLQTYEAIAAVFWQSASYVIKHVNQRNVTKSYVYLLICITEITEYLLYKYKDN